MTINERVSPERLAHIRASYEASRKGYAFIGHPSYNESIAIIDELQQYRAAAEKPVYQVLGDGKWTDYSKQQLEDLLKSKPSTLFRVAYAAPQVTSVPDGIEAAAKWVDAQREAYDDEHGRYDPDTGTFEFGNEAQLEYSTTLAEIAEGIRTLHPAAAPAVQAERPVVQLPVEFYSEHGIVVQLEKVLAALAVQGVKYERRGLAKGQLSGNTEQVSQPYTLPADYLQGYKDGCEWSALMAEANHPQTGDWLFDDPIELAKAIRKGPDMPPVEPGNSPAIPDGYALVPIEPTKEMIDAGWSYYMTTKSPSSLGVYGAMLAAAPKREAERHGGE